MTSTREDDPGVTQVHVGAQIMFLATRSATESQNIGIKGQCPPRSAGLIILGHLPLSTSTTQSGGSSNRSHLPFFSAEIERAKFPVRFVPPNLAVYNGKGDPVGHLSRYRQSIALHNSNDALMCRIFPSSLGEVGLRWFDRLDHGSIR